MYTYPFAIFTNKRPAIRIEVTESIRTQLAKLIKNLIHRKKALWYHPGPALCYMKASQLKQLE